VEDLDAPCDVAAEEALLGSMLWDARAALDVVTLVAGSDLSSAPREVLFDAILAAQRRCGGTADLVMVYDELRRQGQQDRVPPLELARLFDLVPGAASAGHYAEIVARMARRRRIMAEAERLYRAAADVSSPEADLAFDERRR
jgi:replicative DNA helicase